MIHLWEPVTCRERTCPWRAPQPGQAWRTGHSSSVARIPNLVWLERLRDPLVHRLRRLPPEALPAGLLDHLAVFGRRALVSHHLEWVRQKATYVLNRCEPGCRTGTGTGKDVPRRSPGPCR